MIHSTTNRLPRGSGRTACGVMNLPGLTNSRLLGKPSKAQTSSLTPSAQTRRSSWSRTASPGTVRIVDLPSVSGGAGGPAGGEIHGVKVTPLTNPGDVFYFFWWKEILAESPWPGVLRL